VGAAVCKGGTLRAGVAAFPRRGGDCAAERQAQRIEMRRVTPDVSISFDRRRPVGDSDGSGAARRHDDHDMGACRQASADRKGVTVKAESSDLDLSGCDQLTRRDTRRLLTTSPMPCR
jgi:hypothetical protein